VSILVLARDRDLGPVDLNNACKALGKQPLWWQFYPLSGMTSKAGQRLSPDLCKR